MVDVGQEAIKPAGMDVIGVARLFRKVVMDVVGDHIDFLRDDLEDQVAHDKKPEAVGKGEGVMGGVAVQVDRAVGAQKDHAVNEADDQKLEGEVVDEKSEKERCEEKHHQPATEGQPVFAGLENVDPGEKLTKKRGAGWDIKLPVSDEAVRGRVQNAV